MCLGVFAIKISYLIGTCICLLFTTRHNTGLASVVSLINYAIINLQENNTDQTALHYPTSDTMLYLYVGEHIKPKQPCGETCFYSATITLDPPVTLVLHGLLPLHSLYTVYVLLHNIRP